MDRIRWNDMQDNSSNKDTDDVESYADIPPWDEIFDSPITHSQEHDQMTPQPLQNHLQHQNFQSVQPGTLRPLGQSSATDVQIFYQNQERVQGNSMYVISQHPQHLTNQATLSASKDVPSSEAILDMLPTSAVTQQQYHPHIQQQLPPEDPLRTFPQLLARTLKSNHIPGLSMMNQDQKLSSQMRVVQQSTKLKEKVMRHYASTFKIWRQMLGFSPDDVSLELYRMYKKDVSKYLITLFETLNLRLEKMCDLKLILDHWLANIEASLRIYPSLKTTECDHPRTTNIITPTTARQVLEKAFLQNPNPAVEEIEQLAKSLTLDNESVSIWFSNRREVLNRIQSLTACTMESEPERMEDEEDL